MIFETFNIFVIPVCFFLWSGLVVPSEVRGNIIYVASCHSASLSLNSLILVPYLEVVFTVMMYSCISVRVNICFPTCLLMMFNFLKCLV